MDASGDFAWLTGFLEGEGCFIAHKYVNAKGYDCIIFSVQASTTDKDVAERAAAVMNGAVSGPYFNGRRIDGADAKPIYVISVKRREEVVELCLRLLPHMGERRVVQIGAVLEADSASVGAAQNG